MSDIESSISEREAEQQYPTQYWEGTKIKRSFDMTTDDLQDAYRRGREAEPCEEQVEAGAIALFEKQTNFSKGVNHTEDDVRDAWIHMPEINQMRFRELARAVLDAARKTVM